MRLSFSPWLSILGFVLPSGVEVAVVLEVERVVLGSSFVEAGESFGDSDQAGFGSAELGGFIEAAGLATAGFGLDFHVIPEPGTGMLIGLGLALLARMRPMRRRSPVLDLTQVSPIL